MKEIIFVTNRLKGGGAETVIQNLVSEFSKENYKVKLILINETSCHSISEVELYCLGEFNIINKIFKLKKILNNTSSLVTSHLLVPNIFVSLINPKNHWIVLHTTLSRFKYSLKNLIFKILINRNNIAVVSNGIRDDLIENYGCKFSDIKVVYNPIKSTSSIFCEDFCLFSIGRLESVKRIDLQIKALNFLDSNYNLKIIGEGSLKEDLMSLTRSLNLQDRVSFLGWKDNPFDFVSKDSILLLTSDFEGLPMVLVEALEKGIKVISTNCKSGPNEILTGPLSKYLIPTDSVDDLVRVIKIARSEYPLLDKKYIERFSIYSVMKNYLELLED